MRRRVRHSSNPSIPGQHDVDQHDVGCGALKQLDRLFATLGFVDDPTLVFERELHRRTDSLVVFDRKDSCTHSYMMPHFTC